MSHQPIPENRGEPRSPGLYRAAVLPVAGYPLLYCWRKGLLPSPRGTRTARLPDGRLLQCQLSDATQRTMYLGLFEPTETRLVGRLLGPGDTFVDVGAHMGWYTTLAARLVGEAGTVIACEPYPANIAGLTRNLALNDAHHVSVVSAAIGEQVGRLRLASAGDSGSVTALSWADQGSVEVPMTTLDAVAGGLADVTLLKIDVEGWESHVLSGSTATLKRTRNVLIEINLPALARARSSREELIDMLRQAGFTTFDRITQTGIRRFQDAGVSNLLASRTGALTA